MLLTKLIEKQGETTDTAFAERLGIPRETWVALRAGRVKADGRVLVKLIRATAREFPDLTGVAISTLLSDGNREIAEVA